MSSYVGPQEVALSVCIGVRSPYVYRASFIYRTFTRPQLHYTTYARTITICGWSFKFFSRDGLKELLKLDITRLAWGEEPKNDHGVCRGKTAT